jgi:hypothetical protein
MSQFNPKEIMFAATTLCNLHCAHCFVARRNQRLSIQKAQKFIESAISKDVNIKIERIGFTGGEPFLYPEFIEEITKTAITNDLMFDQIMTNGVWWSDEQQLKNTLQRIYDAGYDGKFGVSFDAFHGQNIEKLLTFFTTVYDIWKDGSAITIQSVIAEENADVEFLQKLDTFSQALGTSTSKKVDKRGVGIITLKNDEIFIPIYRFRESHSSENPKNWNAKKWFKDDYCEGPGHVLYVHSNGNVAPCCGFANENSALCIGTIDNSIAEIIEASRQNTMVKVCYENGLALKRKQMQKNGEKFPGITDDNCLFCDYLCKQ